MTERERKARELGNDPEKLKARLMSTREFLETKYRTKIKRPRFDFANKRLVSECGGYSLQWYVRPYPDEPESYINQQSSRGCLRLLEHRPLEKQDVIDALDRAFS